MLAELAAGRPLPKVVRGPHSWRVQSVWRRIVPLLPVLLALSAWHVWDARRHGEPTWIPVVAAVVVVGLLVNFLRFLSRPIAGLSDKEAWARAAKRLPELQRWAAVFAVAGVAVRVAAYLAGYR